MEEATEVTMEHKEELMMVSGSNPTRRPAHFLNPSLSSFNLPITTTFIYSPNNYIHTYHNLSSHVSFIGWKNPLQKWNEWVDRMELLHRSTWHNAGIYHSIMASRNHMIKQDVNLVLALSERWCNVTNTFVFPWGVASVSLEDVFVLGGYSVLGKSVISPIQDRHEEEFSRMNEKLNKVRGEMNRSKSKKVGQVMWMDHYMGSGSEVEHEAFLVLWLSRYVFPFSRDVVGRHLHKIAFGLARGTRVALAPAVLAYLYRDLSSLKERIVDFSKGKAIEDRLNLWSQMQLVQVWAWERFPSISPQYNIIGEGELRMGRWNNLETESDIESVRLVIDDAAEEFVWRPYSMLGKFDFYPANEKWILICPGMQEDYMSFAKFVRASELVGLDCLASYSPHRVSMQFGIDQDIPGKVACFDGTPEIAWQNFNTPIGDEKLYIASKTYESAVTQRYFNWWKDSKLVQENVVEGNDGIMHGAASRCSKKHKAVKDNISSKRKKVNSGRFVHRMTRARKESVPNVKIGNDQSNEIIELDKISDDDTSSPLVASQIPKCPPGFETDEKVQMALLNETTELSENVIGKHEKVLNDLNTKITELDEISDDDTSSPLVASRIPKCPPGFETDEIVQMELLNETTKLSENVIGRHEEAVIEHPGEGTVSVNNDDDDDEEEKSKAARLKKLSDLPLETRISRLETLTAKLQKERHDVEKAQSKAKTQVYTRHSKYKEDCDPLNNLTTGELLRLAQKSNVVGERVIRDDKCSKPKNSEYPSPFGSNIYGAGEDKEIDGAREEVMVADPVESKSFVDEIGDEQKSISSSELSYDAKEYPSWYEPRKQGMKLEDRISRLERLTAKLKAERFGHNV